MTRFDPQRSLASLRHEFGEHGGVNLSIETSTTFTVMDASTVPELFQGRVSPERGCYLYGRHFNPTVAVLGRQLAALEGGELGYCTASGMGAIAAVLTHFCDSGDHIVSASAVYGGTYALLDRFLPKKAGVHTTFVDASDLAAVESALTPRTRIVYVEAMSNPTLRVADLPALAAIAHRHGALLVVDGTFCPLILSPLQHGADVVVHSLTKFVNGASDLIAGAVIGSRALIQALMDLHLGPLMLLGPTMDPRAAYEISMRLPHLALRVAEHSRRAESLARRLAARGEVVVHPALESHPDHALLKRLANPGYGFGGVLTVDLGTTERAERFMEHLQNVEAFGLIAVSLGYAETLLSCPAISTSSEMTPEDLHRAGITPGLVRMSVGITGDLDERWAQLERALEAV